MIFENVQALRAIAASLVVTVHLQGLWPPNESPQFFAIYGYAGVDLFFVISGFIMVRTTANRCPSGLSFFVNRICRVAPLYYAATLLVFVIAIGEPSVLKSTSADIGELIKSLLFVPFAKSPDRIYPLYFLGWTLNYEMIFYALFALAISLTPKKRVWLCSLAIIAAVVAGSILEMRPETNVAGYVYTRPIMLDFVLGMIIGHFQPALSKVSNRIDSRVAAVMFATIAIVLFGTLPFVPNEVAPNTNTFVYFGIPSAFVLLAAVVLEGDGYRLRMPLVLSLGNSSYSMYLFHYFIVATFIYATTWYQAPPALMSIITFSAVCIVSILVFKNVESPLVSIAKRILADKLVKIPRISTQLSQR